MADEKLLTIREVSQALGISEKEVIDLSENGSIPAYKIGGVYLRFKRQQVDDARVRLKLGSHQHGAKLEYSFAEKVSDFFYFNDFYIISILMVVLILWVIFRGY